MHRSFDGPDRQSGNGIALRGYPVDKLGKEQ